ncbi:DUF3600 domain-containing protein [Metabacillus fastidiosus]|uniref:DUF3600 domain-containing protein n=1 Tax=Metabacillus fastidiosus TaxID=1458 RepID=UPI0008265E86|nr:DUF3600 domain-containing protein [Metabacillus fastidiosus]MED4462616.1 DUF3600 domain-containing protein [Metabacillus fastidiosus]
MNLENQVKQALQERGKEVIIPLELKGKVMNQIVESKTIKRRMPMKKRLAVGIIAAALLVPTSAFAYQSILADGIFGSFENLRKHGTALTIDGYMTFNAKLMQAKGELGEKEYGKFKESLRVITNAKLEYGNKYGNTDFDQMSSKEKAKIERASMELQPYFDKLNGDISSKEILTHGEYEQYIEALMAYEKVLAQANIDTSKGPVEAEKLPKELKEEFQQAKNFLDYVSEKQQAIKE